MDDADLTYIVCPLHPEETIEDLIPGSAYFECQRCGHEIAAGPIGVEKINNEGAIPFCRPCSRLEIDENPQDEHWEGEITDPDNCTRVLPREREISHWASHFIVR